MRPSRKNSSFGRMSIRCAMRLDSAKNAVMPPMSQISSGAEAVAAQDFVVRVGHRLGRARELAGKIQHGLLPRCEVGLAMVNRHLVGDLRILRVDAQDGTVRDHAVWALVEPAGGDDDHFFLGFRQPGFLQHQRVVIREEGAKLVRPVRQRHEYIRNEPGLLLHFEHLVADVGRQVFELGHWVLADGLGHWNSGKFKISPQRHRGHRENLRKKQETAIDAH